MLSLEGHQHAFPPRLTQQRKFYRLTVGRRPRHRVDLRGGRLASQHFDHLLMMFLADVVHHAQCQQIELGNLGGRETLRVETRGPHVRDDEHAA